MNMRVMTVLTAALLMLLLGNVAYSQCCPAHKPKDKAEAKPEVIYITLEKLQTMIAEDKNLVIIDVLSAESFAKSHVKGAINIPLAKFESGEALKDLDKEKTYVVYCANQKCKASTKAAEILLKNGYKNVFDYENGLEEWEQKADKEG